MSQAAANSEVTSIPFKSVRIVEDLNYRAKLADEKKRREMAASMKSGGQLQPIVVEAADAQGMYTLVAGSRRCIAFVDNGWQNREIMVVVKKYKKGEAPVARLVDQWRENRDRVDPDPLDDAARAYQFVNGTYPVLEGEKAEPLPKDKVCELLNVSTTVLNDMLRMHTKIDPSVAQKARKVQIPVRVLRAMSAIDGKTEEERTEKQETALETYVSAQKELEDSGRRRAPKRKKKPAPKEESSGGIISADRKIPSGYTEKTEEEPRAKKYSSNDYLLVLRTKQKATKDKAEVARLQGAIDVFRFFTGDLERLPGLTSSDFKVLEVEEEEDEESDAAAEE